MMIDRSQTISLHRLEQLLRAVERTNTFASGAELRWQDVFEATMKIVNDYPEFGALKTDDPEEFATAIWRDEALHEFLRENSEKKINCIKEVRAATFAGLKEAKDAVEYYYARFDWMQPWAGHMAVAFRGMGSAKTPPIPRIT